ncbi:hypothetical protein IFM89_000281 [Coptis chinensis]|uniref:C2 NT-type domain-containing protein n=1 Tax=Coptis chinensis TaxID=261450 RepID=A0A835HEF4_9MAGN|nr:hypothetical protein IFM89_000281 [Coptis chinensis]
MVLEPRANNSGGKSVQVDYIVYIQEIKPWPPSHSLRSLPSVYLQWKIINLSSGSTRYVIPSIGPSVGDGKIKFNESFKLPSIFLDGEDIDTIQNNYLEFNLYEPQRDKTVKDNQPLGTVIVDLAKYGDLRKTVTINNPIIFKRGLRITAQPVLLIKIQPINKHGAFSSSRISLPKEASINKAGGESVNKEYIDKDLPLPVIISPASEATEDSPHQEDASEPTTVSAGRGNGIGSLPQEPEPERLEVKHVTSGTDADVISNNSRRSLDRADLVRLVHEKIVKGRNKFKENAQQLVKGFNTNSLVAKHASSEQDPHAGEKTALVKLDDSAVIRTEDNRAWDESINWHGKEVRSSFIASAPIESKNGERWHEKGQEEQSRKENDSTEDKGSAKFSPDATQKFITSSSATLPCCNEGSIAASGTFPRKKPRHPKSIQTRLDSATSNESTKNSPCNEEIKEIDVLIDFCSGANTFRNFEKKDTLVGRKDVRNSFTDGKARELECKIEKLERELREAAAAEVSLYSIVAEHGNSTNRVYAPARRLSRLYLHACRNGSAASRESAAKTAVSGLVLVVKACATDVPRLTFWLSNSVVLRASISKADEKLQLQAPSTPYIEINESGKPNKKRSSLMKQKVSPHRKKGRNFEFTNDFDDWEDPNTFTSALERIEAWIFSRIIESLWWQTFTPPMQSASGIYKARKKQNHESNQLGDQERVNFSLELWKKAIEDAYEKLCPVRAGGHDCVCLPALGRLILVECVGRLDVAMFNALLRESAEKLPTDPVSDPISNSAVLPVSAGKFSFGTGAQLKKVVCNRSSSCVMQIVLTVIPPVNRPLHTNNLTFHLIVLFDLITANIWLQIGIWSSSLTDLFGTLDGNSKADANKLISDDKQQVEPSFKFHLLNELSDLLMLPKDMLLSYSFRKEVCPTFAATLIKRVLNNFVPDEFCPYQTPEAVFKTLVSEELEDKGKESIRYIQQNAILPVYMPISTASVASILQVQSDLERNKSLVQRKSNSSDDELDAVDSPFSSIIHNKSHVSRFSRKAREIRRGVNIVRYELLREVWMEED